MPSDTNMRTVFIDDSTTPVTFWTGSNHGPDASFVVRAADSQSAQGYTPFEEQELTGRVKTTFLRGRAVYRDGNIVGAPRGKYLRRPAK